MKKPNSFSLIMSYLRRLTQGHQHTIIATSLDATCEKTMETLESTLQNTHDWAVDRLHTLCANTSDDVLESVENAHALRAEFAEWLDPTTDDHEIYSLEYLGEND